jgi:hypothetical protein
VSEGPGPGLRLGPGLDPRSPHAEIPPLLAASLDKRSLIVRASPFFVLSFFWAGALHILPQVYLLTHAPENKGAVLAAILGLGTLGATAGVSISRQRLRSARPLATRELLGWLLASVVAFAAVALPVEPVEVYVLAIVAFRVVSNVLYNHLDVALVDAAGIDATRHAAAVTVWQISGQTLGPAAFVAMALVPHATLIAVLGVGVLAGLALARLRHAVTAPPTGSPGPRAPLSTRARALLAYTFLLQTGVAGLLGQMVFLLEDWVRLAAPARGAGLLITGMGVLSVATVIVSRRALAGHPARWTMVWPALLMALAPGVVATRPGVGGLCLVALAAGVGGGRFMVGTRQLVSAWPERPGPADLLGRFNNITNLGNLAGYVLSGGVALALGEGHLAYTPTLLAVFGGLFLSAAALAALRPFTGAPPSAAAPA